CLFLEDPRVGPVMPEHAKISLSALILTGNEEKHIARCIRSLAGVATEVFVVDSFSGDRTVAIATELGAKVVQRKFRNQADQFQWGLDNLPLSGDWIIRIDADEYLTPELAASLCARIPMTP